MVTPNLDITEVLENQTNKYLTINAAIARLEGAGQGVHVDSAAGTAIVLTAVEFYENVLHRVSGGSADFTLTTLGETPTGAVATERFFIVQNSDTTYDCTVQSDGAGTDVVVPQGEIVFLYQTGDDIIDVSPTVTIPAAPTIPYDMAFYFSGTVDAVDQVIAHIEVARTITIPDDFSGSQAYIGTNPAATFVFDIAKNGTAVGTLSISTGGVPTFATTGTTVTMVAGDRLTISGPDPVEATGADIGITLAATVD